MKENCQECGAELDSDNSKHGYCFDCLEDFWEFDK